MGRKTFALMVYFFAGLVIAVAAYVQDIYPLEQAVGYLSRAQSAAYAEDMASYAAQALPLLPREGNPVWIFPTKRTDFQSIRNDITSMIARLEAVAATPRESGAYAQTLNDLRGKMAVVINQIYEAMPYIIFKPANVAAASAYLLTPLLLRKIFNKHRETEHSKTMMKTSK
ncbi:MAG: hypothetical protein QXG69_00720 [Candidatus Caldarchaeum sp.]|uniref:DUF2937 family protein n=1 Tax=Caldiarchaeum subterraneum TaxID=311458 RepID=A0A7C5QNG0_CALS0